MTTKDLLKEITKYEAKMIEAQIAGDKLQYDINKIIVEYCSMMLGKFLRGEEL